MSDEKTQRQKTSNATSETSENETVLERLSRIAIEDRVKWLEDEVRKILRLPVDAPIE